MDPFSIMSKWPWVVFIAFTVVYAGVAWVASRRHVRDDPELAPGYKTIVTGILTWGNIPWIVMGIGLTVGGVPSMFHFFRPRDANPFVLAFLGSVFLLWGLTLYWVFLRGGAELLARHPLPSYNIRSPLGWKIFWLACIAGGVIAVIEMFTQDIPLPPQ